MTNTEPLPHDPYITAVADALAAARLDPDSRWTSAAETDPRRDDNQTMLSAILIWEGDHHAVTEGEMTDGMVLIWEHSADQWQWGERGPHGTLINGGPEFLPSLGLYSDPAAVVETVRALLGGTATPGGHAPYWHPADAVKAAVDQWAASDLPEQREACGESGCICYGTGAEHAECTCSCDCPRYTDEDGNSVIVGADL